MTELEDPEPSHVLPPWTLRGDGFIFPLWAQRDYNLAHGFIPPDQREAYRGGLGAWMLVRYTESGAGPYDELLYMPGTFRHRGRNYKRITKIYVSQERAQRAGIHNWGIPKELASFSFQEEGNTLRASVSVEGHPIFHVTLPARFPSLPLLTLGTPPYLLQPVIAPLDAPEIGLRTQHGEHLKIPVLGRGHGWGRYARCVQVESDEAYFPDVLRAGSFRSGLACSPFQFEFPVPDHVVGPTGTP